MVLFESLAGGSACLNGEPISGTKIVSYLLNPVLFIERLKFKMNVHL